MSIRDRFKRIQGKVKAKSSQWFRSSSATSSAISLPSASATSSNISPVPISFVGGIRTSSPTPVSQASALPLFASNQPTPSSRTGVDDQPAQATLPLPKIFVTVPSTSNGFDQMGMDESIPNRDIVATAVTQLTQTSADLPSDSPFDTQEYTTPSAYTLPASSLAPMPLYVRITGGEDVLPWPALSVSKTLIC